MGSAKTHILVIPLPAQGHINPMLQFAKRLAEKGPKVTLVTTTSMPKPSTEVQCGLVHIERISDGFSEGEKIEDFAEYLKRFKAAFSKSLGDLLEKQNMINRDPVKVLVYDSVMPWVLDIGHRLGLRGAAFFTQSIAVSAIYYHVHEGALELPLKGSVFSFPSIPLLKTKDMPSFLYDLVTMYPTLLDLVLSQFSNFKRADWLLFNTFDRLEHEVLNWMKSQWPMIKTIGPTLPSMYLDKRLKDDKDYGLNLFTSAKTCMEWLDRRGIGSVVYVSFGSLAKLGEEQMEELAWGLKGIKSQFLWVVRETEVNKLPSDFVIDTSEKGLVVNWCSQLEVLAHRAVGCFVTHCGWNSTIEGLSLGVPIVAMPHLSDQTTNAKYIADVWKLGMRVKVNEKGLAMRKEIEMCINEVMRVRKGGSSEIMLSSGKSWLRRQLMKVEALIRI